MFNFDFLSKSPGLAAWLKSLSYLQFLSHGKKPIIYSYLLLGRYEEEPFLNRHGYATLIFSSFNFEILALSLNI